MTGSPEKGLQADIFVNRNGLVTQAEFRADFPQHDEDFLRGEAFDAGIRIPARMFGFCGGSHQLAAVNALEHIADVLPPPNARLIRSIAQATEILQNSIRWFYTTFAPDLTHSRFSASAQHQHLSERFSKMRGTSFRPGIFAATMPMRLYTLFAGQWPHADFIQAGGVKVSLTKELLKAAVAFLDQYQKEWLEAVWLKGSLDRYLAAESWQDLAVWLLEGKHAQSDLGLLIQGGLDLGLDEIGQKSGSFLAYGTFWDPTFSGPNQAEALLQQHIMPGGLLNQTRLQTINVGDLMNFMAPHAGVNQPFLPKETEVGPLARMLMAGQDSYQNKPAAHPLIHDVVRQKGAGVFSRVLARMHEVCLLTRLVRDWIQAIEINGPLAENVPVPDGIGLGLTEAPRGALAHYVELENQRIKHYRILPPTLLNVQAHLSKGNASPLEVSLRGLTIQDLQKPVEVGLIARSFDSCQVCDITFHKSRSKKELHKIQV
ncbi:MAG: nickel-dependent hydrogenase large subunit [Bacteroidota bacterium]